MRNIESWPGNWCKQNELTNGHRKTQHVSASRIGGYHTESAVSFASGSTPPPPPPCVYIFDALVSDTGSTPLPASCLIKSTKIKPSDQNATPPIQRPGLSQMASQTNVASVCLRCAAILRRGVSINCPGSHSGVTDRKWMFSFGDKMATNKLTRFIHFKYWFFSILKAWKEKYTQEDTIDNERNENKCVRVSQGHMTLNIS